MGLSLFDLVLFSSGSVFFTGYAMKDIESRLPKELQNPRALVRSDVLMKHGWDIFKYTCAGGIATGIIGVALVAYYPNIPTGFSIEYESNGKKDKD